MRIVVIVVNKNAHIKPCNILSHGLLSLRITRKSEVYIICIKSARDKRLIGITRSRSTTALGDRRAVEYYRLFDSVVRRRFYYCALVDTNINVLHSVIKRKVKFEKLILAIIFSVKQELNIPVKYIGVGEKAEDLQPFNAKDFVDALFE